MVSVPQESLMRWTVDEIQRMIESGGFPHPERFELVEGLILRKMGQNEPHIVGLTLALEALREVFAGKAKAKAVAGVPLRLSEDSAPEPDVMVVVSDLRRGIRVEEVLLVVEVADTSLRTDGTVKAALYARHGIPEYLILDVVGRRAEIRRHPEGEGWRETLTLTESGEFTPLGASRSIRVGDLLMAAE
jgi:Uma2 family endonuclease